MENSSHIPLEAVSFASPSKINSEVPTQESPDRSLSSTSTRKTFAEPHPELEFYPILKNVANTTQKGFLAFDPNKINQDQFIQVEKLNDSNDKAVLGVLDGHGKFGHIVSLICAQAIQKSIELGVKQKDLPYPEILKLAFASTTTALQASNMLNWSLSGSTAVVSIITPTHIYTANAGDSRAVIGRTRPNLTVKSYNLSIDQKPERKDERNRIISAGGQCSHFHDSNGIPIGPLRVWLPHQQIPGLAMTRSLGDGIAKAVGVTSEPEIKVTKRRKNDKFVIWASDGVWEFLTSQQVVNIVAQTSTPSEACEKVIAESTRLWKKHETVIDDITMVVAFL